jgi:hypothetical protein
MFTNSYAEDLFDGGSIEKLAEMDYSKFFIFYVIVIFTNLYLFSLCWGYKSD